MQDKGITTETGYIVFSSWFLQFVLAWLAENEEVSVEFMHGALERDKREGVSRNTREGFSQCLTLIQWSRRRDSLQHLVVSKQHIIADS